MQEARRRYSYGTMVHTLRCHLPAMLLLLHVAIPPRWGELDDRIGVVPEAEDRVGHRDLADGDRGME